MKKLFWILGIGFAIAGAFFSQTASAKESCQGVGQDMCIQLYSPSYCVALSVGGVVTKKPLLAKGYNACAAMNTLRKKACSQGLDWKSLDDEEVHCIALPR
ncbi:MAG: hypothetical protein EB078_01295 [Proteobacteria bacterium]|nr:hypothetical protein [Pseudomonadota bacterium]NDC24285.1 hypothetical protein [Pseudomonadota bacterium]NDD03514.1 hypothetical protein [Pseudomonadota bacterium]NDG27582.1 hypothetical protein [Pseudomonadota bacterium]